MILTFFSILEAALSTISPADLTRAAAACSFLDMWPRKDACIFVAALQSSDGCSKKKKNEKEKK